MHWTDIVFLVGLIRPWDSPQRRWWKWRGRWASGSPTLRKWQWADSQQQKPEILSGNIHRFVWLVLISALTIWHILWFGSFWGSVISSSKYIQSFRMLHFLTLLVSPPHSSLSLFRLQPPVQLSKVYPLHSVLYLCKSGPVNLQSRLFSLNMLLLWMVAEVYSFYQSGWCHLYVTQHNNIC